MRKHSYITTKVDKNTITGFALIIMMTMGYLWLSRPSEAQLAHEKHSQDSIAAAQKKAVTPIADAKKPDTTAVVAPNDPVAVAKLTGSLGAFAASATGKAEDVILENDKLKLTFSTKGGAIKAAEVKGFLKYVPITNKIGEFTKAPVQLLDNPQNRFDYTLPVGAGVHSSDLYFTPTTDGNKLTFRASAGEGKYFEQSYELPNDSYTLQYKLHSVGLNDVFSGDKLLLNWENYLDKMEKYPKYEVTLCTVNYKKQAGEHSYTSYGKTTDETLAGADLHWISHTQQFFNTSLIADSSPFLAGAKVGQEAPEDNDVSPFLTKLNSQIAIPYKKGADENFAMRMYVGPNDYDRLKAEKADLEEVISFGWSIFGVINRWVMRPIFLFLSSFIGSAGIVILLLTLLVKLILYPLSYKMIHSQAKMGVVKPLLEKLKAKFGDDQQSMQVEQMKLYREYGVNPLGGCLPMVVQLPVWLALYRFFPASLEFRQKNFLWADDLSSYDSIYNFGFNVPFYGDHISLFAILWAVTTLAYTYYNSKDMDFSANPAMKYMQYVTPVIFVVFFNNFAAGLACYLVFSNLLNIVQTLVTKNYLINMTKLAASMEAEKNNPTKKSGGFQGRLENIMKQQQALQAKQKKA